MRSLAVRDVGDMGDLGNMGDARTLGPKDARTGDEGTGDEVWRMR